MQVRAFGATDVGKVRSANEDSFLVDPEWKLYIVADGMGGHQGGGYASSHAVKRIQEEIAGSDDEQERTQPVGISAGRTPAQIKLRNALLIANDHLFKKALEDPNLRGMGTTVTAMQLEDSALNIAHVGDSRLYLLRDGSLRQLTKDHSWVQEQVDSGVLTDEEAKTHPLKNIITRSLGHDRELLVDLIKIEFEPGDKYMMCSDGLTNMVDDDLILEVMSEMDVESAVNDLVRRALEAGGLDNVTAVMVEILK